MAEYMMIMKGPANNGDWQSYIAGLQKSGKFRGGSILGNGTCVSKNGSNRACTVTGFMRFEASDLNQVIELVSDNPNYESGGEIEILELIVG